MTATAIHIPKISIVMAAYNEERHIGSAIASIQAQTFTDWELIIVNDGSKDRTSELAVEYATHDSRIQLINNPHNLGLPRSLNLGIEVANAELIARADADDFNLPERLAQQFHFMQNHPEVDVLGTGAWLLDANGERIRTVALPQTHQDLAALPFLKTHFFHPSVMIRKRFFPRVGHYNSDFIRTEDKELWLRGLKMGAIYSNLEEPLIEYRTNGYVRSWKSIISRGQSILKLQRQYQYKFGYISICKSLIMSLLIKMKFYNPLKR